MHLRSSLEIQLYVAYTTHAHLISQLFNHTGNLSENLGGSLLLLLFVLLQHQTSFPSQSARLKRGRGAVEEGRDGEGDGSVGQKSKRRRIKEGDQSSSDTVDASIKDSLAQKHAKGSVFWQIACTKYV